MPIKPGTHTLGPQDGTLSVRTGKGGAAAVAAHNLLIEVGKWRATVDVGAAPDDTKLTLSADARSFRVVEGSGGISGLDEDDRQAIANTINAEVLKGTDIEFRSGAVSANRDGSRLTVEGGLALAGRTEPITFELTLADGRVTGSASLKQSDWGMKPYSTLFGTLKVADELRVEIDAGLPSA
jgi:polyisoprenoid-binding protein YceI